MPVINPKQDLLEAISIINELLLAHSKEGGEIDRRLSTADAISFVKRINQLYGVT